MNRMVITQDCCVNNQNTSICIFLWVTCGLLVAVTGSSTFPFIPTVLESFADVSGTVCLNILGFEEMSVKLVGTHSRGSSGQPSF